MFVSRKQGVVEMLSGTELVEHECARPCRIWCGDMSLTCGIGKFIMACWAVFWVVTRGIKSFEGYQGDVVFRLASRFLAALKRLVPEPVEIRSGACVGLIREENDDEEFEGSIRILETISAKRPGGVRPTVRQDNRIKNRD
jgi:hypothetical protein